MTTASLRRSVGVAFAGREQIWMLIGVLTVVAVLGAGAVSNMPRFPSPVAIPWPVLAVCFAIAEIYVIHLEFRADSHSFSLNEVPLVVGLFFVAPGELLIAQALGAGAALLIHRRQPLIKLVFNISNAALGTAIAVLVFQGTFASLGVALGTPDPIGPPGWISVLAAILAGEQLVAWNVASAISLSQPGSINRRHIIRIGTVFALANTCLALVAVTLVWLHPVTVLLPILLAVVLILAYNAYAAELRKRKSMDLLVESTRIAHDSARMETLTRTLLDRARDMFLAERAEMLVFAETGNSGVSFVLEGANDFTEDLVDPLAINDAIWSEVNSRGRAIRLARPVDDERLRRVCDARGIRDMMAAPIRRGDEIIGQILVANRRSDVVTFSADDLHLFETLANHASVSLQNGRLVDELRQQLAENQHQALHDALTGLPNRTMFRQRLDDTLQARKSGRHVAVLMMDLDRFKEVNDTLGHYVGDLLLKQVARRLHDSTNSRMTVARLSGDEFGLLIADLDDGGEALNDAKQLLEVLADPFEVDDLTLEIGASIGVAISPDHGEDPDTLLQRADVAMYLAKDARSGVELYTAERDDHSPARLALSGELRRAIENKELTVFYQPQFALDGQRVGAEALVRWQHPLRGLISPDQFVPMIEHTGLIRPLTYFVLEEAARQCHAWRRAGHELHVAVNLSVRNLLDTDLPDGIARILTEHPIPPDCLHLEITESVIMADTSRTETVLERLDAMGLRLSIDDFGTGLSSYERLQLLPVDELKIDRSFIVAMDHGEKADKIVRSIIDLAHNLGLRVVAEGVESQATWNKLRELGCDIAQGYLVGRPIPATQFIAGLSAASEVSCVA